MNVLILGAGGSIGAALVEEYLADDRVELVIAIHRQAVSSVHERICWLSADLGDASSIDACAHKIGELDVPIHRWVCCSGYLHGDAGGPEKTLRKLNYDKLGTDMSVNALGPLVLFSKLATALKKLEDFRGVFLSAQVGSIEDNQLGGWYGYRMSKAALNMGIKCLAIEMRSWRTQPIVIAVHPGTTTSALSKPFTQSRAATLQSPDACAQRLYRLAESVTVEQSGQFLKLDGSNLPW